jgi:hypothetical protein
MPFRDVEVWVHIPGDGVESFEDIPAPAALPRPPRKWGPKPLLEDPGIIIPPRALPVSFHDMPAYSPSIDIRNDGSTDLAFPPVDLGPESGRGLPAFHLVVPDNLLGQSIAGEWEARSMQIAGVAKGTFTLFITDMPSDPEALLGDAAAAP